MSEHHVIWDETSITSAICPTKRQLRDTAFNNDKNSDVYGQSAKSLVNLLLSRNFALDADASATTVFSSAGGVEGGRYFPAATSLLPLRPLSPAVIFTGVRDAGHPESLSMRLAIGADRTKQKDGNNDNDDGCSDLSSEDIFVSLSGTAHEGDLVLGLALHDSCHIESWLTDSISSSDGSNPNSCTTAATTVRNGSQETSASSSSCSSAAPAAYPLQTARKGVVHALQDGGVLAVGVCANRESTTHGNQTVPDSGISGLQACDTLLRTKNEYDADGNDNNKRSIRLLRSTLRNNIVLTRGGLCGVTTASASQNNNPHRKASIRFIVLGPLVTGRRTGERIVKSPQPLRAVDLCQTLPVSVSDEKPFHHCLSLESAAEQHFNTPVIVVAGSSAEVGKTTLVSKIVRAVKQYHKNKQQEQDSERSDKSPTPKLAFIKATGTGSWADMSKALNAGADAAYDQLDAGLPSTYSTADRVAAHLPRSFLLAQRDGASVIIAEFGGDIVWANNATLLRLPWFARHVLGLFVIPNDALSAIGVKAWLLSTYASRVAAATEPRKSSTNEETSRSSSSSFSSPEKGEDEPQNHKNGTLGEYYMSKLRFVASPFRTYDGALVRHAALGLTEPLNPNDEPGVSSAVCDMMV